MIKIEITIDAIIKEPVGGAHSDRNLIFDIVKKSILKAFDELKDVPKQTLIDLRREKFFSMGVFNG